MLSSLLRKAIIESNVPLLKLEEMTGVKRQSISRFIRGLQSIRLDQADKLAEYFKFCIECKGIEPGLTRIKRQTPPCKHQP